MTNCVPIRTHFGGTNPREVVMSARSFLVILLAACSADATAFAQGPAPVGDANPLPVLDAGGPTAAVTALAFSPDGQTLY